MALAIVFASILAILLLGTIPYSAFAASAGTDTFGLWYLGEGATENMKLKYRVQYIDTNNGRPFYMTILFKEHERSGDWLVNLQILDNVTELGEDIVAGESDLSPLQILGSNSTLIKTYIDAYSHTLQYLAVYAPEVHPKSLLTDTWGKLACVGCPVPKLHSPEIISVSAGTFNTTVFYFGQRLNIWILDDFPYPVKGIAYTDLANSTVIFSYELLTASINDIPIPEFDGLVFAALSLSLSTVLVVTLRLHRKFSLQLCNSLHTNS